MFNWCKNIKVGTSIIVIVVFSIISLVIINFQGVNGMKKINSNMERMYANRMVPSLLACDASNAIKDMRANAYKAIAESSTKYDAQIKDCESKFYKNMAQYSESQMDDIEIKDIKEAKEALREYMKCWETAQLYIRMKKPIPNEISEKWNKCTDEMLKSLDDLNIHNAHVANKLDKEGSEVFNYTKVQFLIVGITSIIILIAISIIVISIIKKGMKELEDILENISQGNFEDTLVVDSKNEFGEMKLKVKKSLVNVSQMIKTIMDVSTEIQGQANNFLSVSNEMTSSSEQVANAVQDIAKGAGSQANNLMKISGSMADFGEELGNIAKDAYETNESSIDVNNKAQSSNKDLIQLVESINEINKAFEDVSKKINNLGESIGGINEITNTINAIADQTNLLALNAAIEAARAGEAGKGFAVVADEIRKLAEQSKKSSGEITKLIGNISNETNLVVDTTDNVKDELNKQINVIEVSIESFKHIIEAIEKIIPKINSVNSSTENINSEKDIIISEVESASSISEEISASSEEIAASSEEMSASSEEVAANANKLSELVKSMVDEVKRFKI